MELDVWRVTLFTLLTVRSAVSEEWHQERHIINVLQMRTDLVDTTRQLGLLEKSDRIQLIYILDGSGYEL